MTDKNHEEGLQWQVGVWDKMADVYQDEIDARFVPIVEQVLSRVGLKEGHTFIDLGSGGV